MQERLQKILSARGVASRRKAEEMIKNGLVFINGHPAVLGDQADPELDRITVDGKPLPSVQQHLYIMLHKPRGYVTTMSDEKGRPTAADLVKDCGARVYPVGRLDLDSEGLLLFTNDGEFANRLMHPRTEVEKTYEVTAAGYSDDGFRKLAEPIVLDGSQIRPPKLKLLSVSGSKVHFEIVIHEGKNRQIRRMCDAAGMKVVRLKRIQEGNLLLGKLSPGKWRYLTPEELKKI